MTFQKTSFVPGSLESMSVGDALATAGMQWTADKRRLFVEDPYEGHVEVETHRAVVRSDTAAHLGVVGADYEPVQQSAAFQWVQPLLDAGEARLVSAGTLGGGRKVYLQAELTDAAIEVQRGDELRAFVNFHNAHDGSLAVGAGYTRIRVICQNTMMAAARSVAFKARHTKGVHDALAAARVEFHAQRAALRADAERLAVLATKKLSDKNLVRYVRETLAEGAGNDPSVDVRGVDRIVELAHTAPGAVPGTLWGGLNAVTYWASHERGRSEDARATALMFGQGGALIERATAVAFAYADKLPTAELGRASYANHATAKAELDALLGRAYVSPTE